jgi:glutamate 5-kinase
MAESGGELVVDDGAVAALRAQHGSLLPAGVRDVKGLFKRGDVVAVVSESGDRIACGITSYDTDDLRALQGIRSVEILERLGHHYGDEAIHRNNMVVL